MEADALSNYNEPEEGEILNDEIDELYTPLTRPHVSSSSAAERGSLPSSKNDNNDDDDDDDDKNASKETSSDSDSSGKKLSSSKIRRKAVPVRGRKKNYNIWCNDIQTEVLTNSLVDCNVDQTNNRDRDIESYNYWQGNPTRESKLKTCYLNNENKKQYSAKRRHDGAYVGEKAKIVSDVKPTKCVQSNIRNILDLSTNADSSDEEIARDIANKLCEEKEELILRAIKILGKKIVISLFEETQKVEASGGMLVMNGTRRRTPGGVFFYLLKTSESISREKRNLVLSEDKKSRVEEKKLSAKKMRQLNAEKFKKSLSKDDFPTLLSRTELAIKEFKARKLAEDSAEVKNPPPSPATDGRECSSDGEEQKAQESVKKNPEDRPLTSYNDSLFDNEECVMDVF